MGKTSSLKGGCDIIDIRQNEIPSDLSADMLKGLHPPDGEEKQIPELFLYDEKGLQIYQEITFLDEYYLINAEIDVLTNYADQIAEKIPKGTQAIELGSGNLRKVKILLEALDRKQKDIDYYALDVSLAELERTLSDVPQETFKYVRCHGLYGTYEDGLKWLSANNKAERPRCIMLLASSIGNFDFDDGAAFLGSFAQILGPGDSMIVCVDGCRDADRVNRAYNDSRGITQAFYTNGLQNANKLLQTNAFDPEKWDIISRYDSEVGRQEAFILARTDIQDGDLSFKHGEKVRLERSHKYSDSQTRQIWQRAGLRLDASFVGDSGTYSLNMLSKQDYKISLDPNVYAKLPVPSVEEWQQLWATWDLVTRQMIPEEELLSKPINLRNCCIFYLGHIPTFLDIQLARATGGKFTEPSNYPSIFERGIDPDVENPELCHAHSEVPDEWPLLEEILAHQERVRNRLRDLYKDGSVADNRKMMRYIWLGFEHEVMHLETLLYMLLQSEKMVSPGPKPDFSAIANEAHAQAVKNAWVKIPETTLHLGLDDPENDEGPDRYFGWDNERPSRTVKVLAFEAQAQPLTNGDYANYMAQAEITRHPASWSVNESQERKDDSVRQELLNGYAPSVTGEFVEGKTVKTVYGPVPLKYALDWPVMASYDELAGCAKWLNGRIPTEEEAKSIYEFVDRVPDLFSNVDAKTIPAVNGHLSNDGVEETPPQERSSTASSTDASSTLGPSALFANLEGCNVGFQHFHPIPVTNSEKPVGLAGMGGVWEWTSSVLSRHEGFKAMDLYPAYTEDFFDGKHNIVLGGSWATHPRVAGRKTFLNWYQRNYPYAWAGARLVRDIQA